MSDMVADIMDFESGEMGDERVLPFFQRLIRTGRAWTLQGSYGRMAHRIIEEGLLTPEGELTHQGRVVQSLIEYEKEHGFGPDDLELDDDEGTFEEVDV